MRSTTGRPAQYFSAMSSSRFATVLTNSEFIDVTFVLQHVGDRHLQLGRGHDNSTLCADCALRMRVSISAIGSVIPW